MIYSLGEHQPVFEGDYYVAPDATVVGALTLGHESSVWFQSVIRADNDRITIGARTNIQDASVLHVDEGVPVTIGDNVSIGHQVMLHGCTVQDGALVGINAVVLNHAVIGAGALVGANALVPEGKQIPPRSLALGSPAKVIRELSDEEVANIMMIADHYAEKSKIYRERLKAWS